MLDEARRAIAAAIAFGLGLLPARHAAAQVALPIADARGASIRVDGALGEWRDVRFLEVGAGPDASMRVALAYDEQGLYLAADVRDERLIRNVPQGPDEDAIILTLALPRGRGHEGRDIYVWAGQTGRSAAAVGVAAVGRRPSPLRGARCVEAGRSDGYTVEAFVPWTALPGAERWQQGRGSVRLRDVDQAARPVVEAEPALAPVDPAHLERLPELAPSGGEHAALESFLAAHGLAGARPAHDLRGDVGGDARPERISIVDRFVVVTGPGWQQGRGHSFAQLPVQSVADVRQPRLVDLTGDGAAELVVTLHQVDDLGARDLLQVFSFARESVTPVFAVETRKETSAGFVEAIVRIERGRRGRPPTLVVRAGQARGLDASSWREAPATDAQPILLPWGPVRSRSFRWNGTAFEQVDEERNPRWVDPAAQRDAVGAAGAVSSGASSAPVLPTPDALLAAFRRARGIDEHARPSARIRADVAAGPELEEIVVYGRDLVVVGPGFRGGTEWFHFEIPAPTPADVLDVRTAEVTGDARQEVLVRVQQRIGEVRRQVLLVHQFTPTGFPCLLQREVAREQGGRRIVNEVVAGGGRLEVRPGTAHGWSAESWAFVDGPSADGVEPPLLPWRHAAVVYRYAGGRLVPR